MNEPQDEVPRGRMLGWTLAKYVLALLGLALVLASDNLGRRWLGWVGVALILLAFMLRLFYRVPRR